MRLHTFSYIYQLVADFITYENIMNGVQIYAPDTNKYNCLHLNYQDIKEYESQIKPECEKIMFYFAKIYNSRKDKYFVHKGLKYLYYWIYERILAMKNFNHVVTIYDRLYKNFITFWKEKNISEIDIGILTESELRKIALLYKMYKCMNNRKKYIEKPEEKEYCDTLSYFISQNKPKYSDISRPWYSRQTGDSCPPEKPCKSSLSRPVLVAFFIAIIMSLFLFYVLKYTSYGSKVISKQKNKRYNRDYIYEEGWDAHEIPQICDNTYETPQMYYNTNETPEIHYNMYDDSRRRIIYNSY
ncbi:variable surface protein [Plasmodium gonderi]|uniref:Variable surface protein n=1 Tax=Plasmodium gonderi TaxID=77519 RepID=A0A1Y1JRS5_PLAGO|nr:variable surface protein [Plasmodium gonderi]GAW83897.1 variable surface protein [Plasmodium gonderi]